MTNKNNSTADALAAFNAHVGRPDTSASAALDAARIQPGNVCTHVRRPWSGARMRLAQGRLRLAGRVVQQNGRAAGVAGARMGAVGGAACGAAGMERLVQGAGCVVSEAWGLALRWIDLGVGARVGCGV